MQRHRAVIVGLGFIGAGDQVSGDAIGGQKVSNLDGTHADALSGHPNVELVAGSSRDAGRRQRFERARGVKTYADWREMLAREKPEIVSVATYAPQHLELTLAAVEHGARVVYCEKPIAQRVIDARRMIEACERAGALLVINHNRHFNPNYRRLRDAVAAGVLGQVTSASLQWGTGRLGNIGTHLIDALMLVTGSEVTAVSGTLDTAGRADCRGADFRDPGGWAMLRLSGGLMATLDAPDNARAAPRLEVTGTLGRATTGKDDVTMDWWDGRRDHWPSPRAQATSMDRAVAEIVGWLDGGVFPASTSAAARTLEAIVAIHLSHRRSGAWIDLPLQGEATEYVLQTA